MADPLKEKKAVQDALNNALRWQPPPNWSATEWGDELKAIAWMVVCLVLNDRPDADEETLTREILRALKRFWRSEWAYAARCVPLDLPARRGRTVRYLGIYANRMGQRGGTSTDGGLGGGQQASR